MTSRQLSGRTLWAGILVGVVGILGVILGPQLFQPLYQDARIANGVYYSVVAVLSSLMSYLLPLSAALIGAFLVMRYAEQRRGASSTAEHLTGSSGTDLSD